MLRINDVFELDSDMLRVLEVQNDLLIYIMITHRPAWPIAAKKIDFESLFFDGKLLCIDDPFGYLENVSATGVAYEKREFGMGIINYILPKTVIYNQDTFKSIYPEVIAKYNVTKPTVHKLLRRYWQRGQVPNALLPDYKNSGGKGKKRTSGVKKLGRPRVFADGVGSNVDEHIEKLFMRMIDKHYLSIKKHSISYAYRRFLEIYQSQFPEVEKEEIPTIVQM